MAKEKKVQIHHLIRYFLILGIVAFVGYANHWQDDVFLFLIGPTLYLCAPLKKIIETVFGPIAYSSSINLFGFVMPVVLVYFGLIGFQLKQLWNEQGFIRLLSLLALIGFLIFIHYRSWVSLSGYSVPII